MDQYSICFVQTSMLSPSMCQIYWTWKILYAKQTTPNQLFCQYGAMLFLSVSSTYITWILTRSSRWKVRCDIEIWVCTWAKWLGNNSLLSWHESVVSSLPYVEQLACRGHYCLKAIFSTCYLQIFSKFTNIHMVS